MPQANQSNGQRPEQLGKRPAVKKPGGRCDYTVWDVCAINSW
jgi:hypothetical protein